jgi:hypothetical protein
MKTSDWDKVNTLREDFRGQAIQFLEALDRENIPYSVGHARRTYEQEVEIWQVGRQLIPNADPLQPASWQIVGDIRTRVFPGSGKGPHPYGLALDVYPKDIATGGIMASDHELFEVTIQAMWRLAEELGIDALGHDDPNRKDEVWSGDLCHFQLLNWRNHLMTDAPKTV